MSVTIDGTNGVTTPNVTSPLNVQAASGFGAIEVGGPSGGFIDIKAPFSDDYDARLWTNGTDVTVVNRNAGNLSLATADAERLTVDGAGRVGIGVTSIVSDAKFMVSKAGTYGIEFSIDDAVAGTNRLLSYNRSTSSATPLQFNAARVNIIGGNSVLVVGSQSDWSYSYDGSNTWQFVGSLAVNQATTTANRNAVVFNNPNGQVGYINTNGSTTIYATSSDYRLKDSIQPLSNALAKVQQLKPCTYKWKADGASGQGFIAHELQAVVPDAVVGEKDAVDADGNPVYQGIDTSFLVATLTAAIQEQQALIDSLTTRIAALEAK